ncbi:MAG: phenylacetate--CoA ligase family protein [Sulfitobacter sp.]
MGNSVLTVDLKPEDLDEMLVVQKHHYEIDDIVRFSKGPIPEDQYESPALQRRILESWNKRRTDLLNSRFEDSEVTRACQFSIVKELVDFAYQNVPFYHELYSSSGYEPGALKNWKDFESLPIVTRAQLAEQPHERLVAKGTDLEKVACTHTSGSSGKAFSVYYGDDDIECETIEYYRQFYTMTDEALDPSRWIYNIHMSRGWLSSLCGKFPTFTLCEVLTEHPVAKHLSLLRPQVLCAPPSYISKLIPLGKTLAEIGIDVIITNSEASSRHERDRFAEIFGVRVLDEYSSAEQGILASECEHGTYHVNEDGIYFELVGTSGDDGFGRTIVTNLRNRIMPMIRYDQGDIASWRPVDKPCPCGQTHRGLISLHGRADDSFIARDGTEVPSASLLNVVDLIFTDATVGAGEFRLVQEDYERINFLYVPSTRDGKLLNEAVEQMVEKIGLLFPTDIEVTLRSIPKMPALGGYKRRKIICNLKKTDVRGRT